MLFNQEDDHATLNELMATLNIDDEETGEHPEAEAEAVVTEKQEEMFPVGSREWRKAQRQTAKAEQRMRREGNAGEDIGRKSCDMCLKRVDLLIRCTIDSTKTWKMVCGKCWREVSGGVPDGDANHPHYTYGGLWKNRTKR